MTALIVGAGLADSHFPRLAELGVADTIYWNGTSELLAGDEIPEKIGLVVLREEYLESDAGKAFKEKVDQRGLKAVYCRWDWPDIEHAVGKALGAHKHKCCGRCATCSCH